MKTVCVSLFSGCGGLDQGIHDAGFCLRFATDNDPLCQKSHALNFPDVPFFLGSISDCTSQTVLSNANIGQSEIDLMVGGPPCQPFSKSRFYRSEKKRGIHDPAGGETIRGYVRMLEELRPKVFLLENVHGFSYKVQRDAFNFVLEAATAAGYQCNWSILNAADYGVPQIRQRFFLIGSQYGVVTLPRPSHKKPESRDLFEEQLPAWVTCEEAIGDLDTTENADDTGHFAGGKHHELLKEVPPGQNYLYFTEKRGHPNPQFRWRSRYWSFLLKLAPGQPSWTIQARRSNNMGPFHWRNRILRIEEVKRLQTFPDDFHLSGTIEQQWRQVGNAVPPLMAYHLGTEIYKHLADHCGLEEQRTPTGVSAP